MKYKKREYKIRIKKRLQKHFNCTAQELDNLLIEKYHLNIRHTREDLEKLLIDNNELHKL